MLHQQFSQEYPNVKQLQNSKMCMILIYANGCPYCDIMQNEWFKAKNDINKKYDTNDVNVVEIERHHANSLFNNSNDDFINTMREETHGYPSIFFKTPTSTKKHNSLRERDIFKHIIDLEMKKSESSKKVKPQPKPKPKPQEKPKAKPQPKPKQKAKPQPKEKPKPKEKSKEKPKPKPKPKAKAKSSKKDLTTKKKSNSSKIKID